MPELPEVEIIKQGLVYTIAGKTIINVDIRRPDLRGPIPENLKILLQRKKITDIIRRGKYILVFLEDGNGFGLHLGMSGRISVYRPKDVYERAKHDHFGLTMQDGSRAVLNDARRFGMLFLVRQAGWEQDKPFSNMGPEPLSQAFDADALAGCLKGRRTPVKSALLDQRVVAGIGNIYACEALYKARISPLRLAASLSKKECARLATALRSVLESAIAAGGSSLRDYRNTKGGLGYFQHHFTVYDREGKACPGCTCDVLKTGGVKRIVQAGRSTFYCAQKQK